MMGEQAHLHEQEIQSVLRTEIHLQPVAAVQDFEEGLVVAVVAGDCQMFALDVKDLMHGGLSQALV